MKAKALKSTKSKAPASKPKLEVVAKRTLKPKKKKSSFLKVLATTLAIGVASAILMRKEKPKSKKPKAKSKKT